MRLHSRILGAVSAAALTLGTGVAVAAPASAEPTVETSASPASTATFDSVKITKLKKKYTLPKAGKTRTVNFTVNVAGTASDGDIRDLNGDGLAIEYKGHDVDFSQTKVVRIKSRVKTSTTPRVTQPSVVSNGANRYSLQISSYVAPGIYELQVPVTQNNWTTSPRTSVTKIAKKRFQVHATKKVSKAATRASTPGWRVGTTATFNVSAPTYQRGAKVTMYFKKQGTKGFKKIKTAKLKGKAAAYQSKATFKTKAVQSRGVVQFRIAKAKWSPAYKAKNLKITIR